MRPISPLCPMRPLSYCERTDYRKMMQIVVDAGYHGYIGIEFEGDKHGKFEGVRLTKTLLEQVRKDITDQRRR